MSKHDLTIGATGHRARTLKRSALMLSAAILAIAVYNPASAQVLPTGGDVVGGAATIGTSGSAMTIGQTSDRAVINWNSFDIGSGASVTFNQPSSTSIAVNRVTSGVAPSQIAGTLSANGVVAILNPNGVMFAGTANVDVGGLIASTGDIDQGAFMAGGNLLGISGANNGEIVVNGGAGITVRNAGLAAFVAPSVRNSGTITATAGRIQLGGGTAFTLDLAGDGLLAIGVGATTALVQNNGTIFADGGRIQMSAKTAGAVVNNVINTNVLSVGSVSVDGSTIVLEAAGGNIALGGTATGKLAVTSSGDIQVASNLNVGSGSATLTGQRIYGAGDVNVSGGALTLNVNNGAIADTSAGNWIGDAVGVIGTVSGAKTVNLGAGLYRLSTTLALDTSLALVGAGHGSTIVDASGFASYGIRVKADNVSLSGFSLLGSSANSGNSNYGIKIEAGSGDANARNDNFSIRDVAISGSRKTGLDINAALGVLIDGVTVTGVTNGNGIAITDSADVTVRNTHTSGNAWGGLALYQSNNLAGGGSNQQLTNVTIEGSNSFSESQGLYLQDSSTSLDPGTLNLIGFNYAVRNLDHRPGDNLENQFTFFRTDLADATAFAKTIGAANSSSIEGYSGTAYTNVFTVSNGLSINAAIRDARAGGTVLVRPGDYAEGVTGVDYFGGVGSQKFGLYVAKDNVTIRGVDASGVAITSASNVAAFVTALYQAGFGAQHFISGTNVTIEGLGFKPTVGGDNKMLEVIGDNFTLRNSVLDVRGNGTAANFYISTFETPGADVVERFTLENNIFYGATLPYDGVSGAGAMVAIAGGVGRNTDASNRIFSGNLMIGGNLVGQRGFQIQGRIPTTPWQQLLTGAVTVTNNSFDNVDIPVRTVGLLTQALNLDSVFRTSGNIFLDGAVMAYAGNSLNARATLTAAGDQDLRITSRISDSVTRALAGDTVRMLDGTYNLGTSQLVIDRGITLVGQSQAGTIIDGRAVSRNGLGTISVIADNTTLSNFTLYGSEQTLGNYGIKVQPNPAGHVNTVGGTSERINNVAISDVTVRGSRRAELDVNGAVGVTITNFTADGRRVADGTETQGAGVQITDSSNVTFNNVHTLGNSWGGVALYQNNSTSGYNAQLTNININAANNSFAEANGLYTQDESATKDFGQLNLAGFNYAVRNTSAGYTFFQTSLDNATSYALALGATAASIEGYTGTAFSNVFTVSNGLLINAATRDARAGGTINVGAGTYAETVKLTRGLTLAGAGMNATSITGGVWLSVAMSDVVLKDFAVSGQVNTSNRTISNQGITTNLTVDGVRIDGLGLAGRNGLVGGQIAGAVSVTNSEFVNIRGFQAFDTGSSTGNNAITSGVFSNNVLDNTVGSIAFRPDPAMNATIDIANNVVTNVGSTTDNVGAVFKVFGGATVNFTGNQVSDVGITNAATSGGPAAGAVLVVRNANLLNVTGNTFTNNNQVFAVDNAANLPTVSNFAGNNFVNNGTSIYISTNYLGTGTINFGAGNNFVAGADTAQHIVWRSGGALNLTQVAFDGVQTSAMSLSQLFAAEDLITDGIDRAGSGLARLVAGNLYVTTASGTDSALRAVALATAGDTLNLSAGTHTLTNTLFLQKSLSVLGQGKGLTTIDASGNAAYGIRVHADNSTLAGFTLLGSSATGSNSNYGIKVEAGNGDANARNDNFAINDVAISGSRKTGLDLNSVLGATIDGVTVTGVTNGNGVAISDSADVTVRNTTTSGNAWGGLALYQTNNLGAGGSGQQLTNITVADNNFGEANGLYLEDSSASFDPGTLNIQGYDFTVRNAAYGSGFTFFRTAVQDALNFAVNLNPAQSDSSVVQGWTGSNDSGEFVVGFGSLNAGGLKALSLQSAFNASSDGDSIYVGSGIYSQTATLTGARALTFSEATFDGLTLNGDGTSIGGTFSVTGALSMGNIALNDATSLIALGDLSVGGVTGGYGLTLSGNAITLGLANVASLTATGTSITTNGVTTTGAQSYTGATTLGGVYVANGFQVIGATTLAGDTIVRAVGTATFGTITGNKGLTISAGTTTLGASNIGSLAVLFGSAITQGVKTTGSQAYHGSLSLVGAYAASEFIASQSTTITGDTAVVSSGKILFNNTIGGTGALTITGSSPFHFGLPDNSVNLLGAVTGLSSLTISGPVIGVAKGASTTGAQSYAPEYLLALGGAFEASSFTVSGGTAIFEDTTVTTRNGPVTFGGIVGQGTANLTSLTVNAGTGDVTLGIVSASGYEIGALTVSGGTITTAGAVTTGAQSYAGALSLNGTYSASDLVSFGTTTISGNTNITTSGDATFYGAIGGAGGLALTNGNGTFVFGGVNDLSSLSVTGKYLYLSGGVSTTGAQSYNIGTLTGLVGAFKASSFSATGPTAIDGATTITTTGGAVTLGSIEGTDNAGSAAALTVNAGTGGVNLGGVSKLTSLSVTGSTIGTAGATTTGAQTYTGATTLNGVYSGSNFSVSDTTTLAGATTVTVADGGTARFAARVSTPNRSSFTVSAGTGTVFLGNLGRNTLINGEVLGETTVTAARTELSGSDYYAVSLAFRGVSADSTVTATQAATEFTANGISGIVIDANLVGQVTNTQDLSLNGLNISVGNVGSNSIRFKNLTVNGTNFSAATVKVVGYRAILKGDQTFTSQTLDALGDVFAEVGGNESGPIVAGGAVSLVAGGSGTGSITAGGPVDLSYASAVSRAITSTGSVSVASTGGSVTGSVTSGGTVNVHTNAGTVGTTINASGPVTVGSTSGAISSAITSSGPVSVTTTGGAVSGAIKSSGAVSVGSGSGAVSSAINSGGAVTVSSTTGTVGGTITSSGPVTVSSTTGTVASAINSTGQVTVSSTTGAVGGSITSTGPVTVTSSSGVVASTIQSGGTVSVTSTNGSVGGSIGATGPVSISSSGTVSSAVNTPGSVAITSNVPVAVQVNGGAVQVNAPGGTVTGVFAEIKTNDGGTFVVNKAPVIGSGTTDARQIIIDNFLAPAGGTVDASGQIQLPVGLALGLIAPAGRGDGQRPPVVVNNVTGLGELLRVGYTAIIIELDDSGLTVEKELVDSDQ